MNFDSETSSGWNELSFETRRIAHVAHLKTCGLSNNNVFEIQKTRGSGI